jgi:flagellar basal-body rod modification protein FlgD
MQIQSSNATTELTTPLPAATASSSTTGTSAGSTAGTISSTDALGNESTFLQLLVAQIQNQDPTAPMDSSTFLTQLAEFSQVEQLIGIRQDVSELDPSTTGTTTPTTGSTSGS